MSSVEFSAIQTMLDDYVKPHASLGVVMGLVTSEKPDGDILYAGSLIDRSQPPGPLPLNELTAFEIGSVSKVFTTGIYYQLQGSFDRFLEDLVGTNITMSEAVGSIPIPALATFSSGLPQDNGHCKAHPGPAYPAGTTATLQSLFGYLATYCPPNQPGTTYAYSNLGMSLLAMAAVELDNLDTAAFAASFNAALINYCQQFGVDMGTTATTAVYGPAFADALPVGFDKNFGPTVKPPCSQVEYGSGGIVSNGSDMLKFLLYNMSTGCPTFMQDVASHLPAYCYTDPPTGPPVGYGWFHRPIAIGDKAITVVCKDGGVAGFTSWLGFQQRPSATAPSCRGLFVLTNGPDATTLGFRAFRLLFADSPVGLTGSLVEISEPAPEGSVQ
jgi:beta-lactamase class C